MLKPAFVMEPSVRKRMKSGLSKKMSPGELYPLNRPTSGAEVLDPSYTSTLSQHSSVVRFWNSNWMICRQTKRRMFGYRYQ